MTSPTDQPGGNGTGCLVCGDETADEREEAGCCSDACAGEAQREIKANARALRRRGPRGRDVACEELAQRNAVLMEALLRHTRRRQPRRRVAGAGRAVVRRARGGRARGDGGLRPSP